MVDGNLRLVVAVARRYRGSSMTMLDLIQEGNLGLIRAVDGYDPRRGYRFSTYATWWIRQSMGRALANKDRTIRIPVHRADKLRRMSRLHDRMTRELGRAPTMAELAEGMQSTAQEIRALRSDAPEVTSLSAPLGEGQATLEDVISLAVDWDLDGRLTEAEARARVDRLLARLNLREQQVMRDRFGLDGTALTLRECGQRWGVTHERVRQIEVEALVKLRQYIAPPEVNDLLTSP
jgi:RNA polymerase primary sigma factor